MFVMLSLPRINTLIPLFSVVCGTVCAATGPDQGLYLTKSRKREFRLTVSCPDPGSSGQSLSPPHHASSRTTVPPNSAIPSLHLDGCKHNERERGRAKDVHRKAQFHCPIHIMIL